MRLTQVDWSTRRVCVSVSPFFFGLVDALPGVVSGMRSEGGYRWFVYFSTLDGSLISSWKIPENCYREGLGREVHIMHLDYLKKAKARIDAAEAQWEVEDAAWSNRYPILFTFLAANMDAEGVERQRSKVSVFVDSGSWKASLVDGETEQSLFVTIRSPEKAYEALEKALAAEEPDWRPWRRPALAEKGKRRLTRERK